MCKSSKSHEIFSHLFESVCIIFKIRQDVHLKNIFVSLKLISSNGRGESMKLLQKNKEDISSMRSRSCSLNSPKTRVCEVVINARSQFNKGISSHQVHDGSAVHSLSRTSCTESLCRTHHRVHHKQGHVIFVSPRYRLKS